MIGKGGGGVVLCGFIIGRGKPRHTRAGGQRGRIENGRHLQQERAKVI